MPKTPEYTHPTVLKGLTRCSFAVIIGLGQTHLMGCKEPLGTDTGCKDPSGTNTKHEAAIDNTGDKAWAPVTYYYIRAKHSNKCMHQHGGVLDNGGPITQWDCVDEPNVQWRIEPSPTSGYYFIKARHSDKCAHQDGIQSDGDPITQSVCEDQDAVKWQFIPAGNESYYIQGRHSGKCMHVHGGGTANGDLITQWSCIDEPNVQWTFEPVRH